MKKKWTIIEIVLIAISLLDVVFRITDQINICWIKMIIGIIIKIAGIVSFIALLSQLAWQNMDHAKKIKALKKFYEAKLDWLETNTKTHYLQAFAEIDKIGKTLINVNFKVGSDPKIKPIKKKFRTDMDKELKQYNDAFKNWGEEYKNNK